MSDENPKQLTVGELIEKLQGFDPNLLVLSDGCDCVDSAVDARLWLDDTILIARTL